MYQRLGIHHQASARSKSMLVYSPPCHAIQWTSSVKMVEGVRMPPSSACHSSNNMPASPTTAHRGSVYNPFKCILRKYQQRNKFTYTLGTLEFSILKRRKKVYPFASAWPLARWLDYAKGNTAQRFPQTTADAALEDECIRCHWKMMGFNVLAIVFSFFPLFSLLERLK